MPYLAFQVAMEPEKYGLPYKIEGALIVGGNTVGSSVQPDLMAKALASIPFVVNIAYNYDESVALSDIVMPDHAMLERMAINTYETTFGGFGEDTLGLKMVLFRDPLPPTYNTCQAQDIVMQMFKRMDLLAPMYGVMNENLMLGEITIVHLSARSEIRPGADLYFAEICDRGLQAIAGKVIATRSKRSSFSQRATSSRTMVRKACGSEGSSSGSGSSELGAVSVMQR